MEWYPCSSLELNTKLAEVSTTNFPIPPKINLIISKKKPFLILFNSTLSISTENTGKQIILLSSLCGQHLSLKHQTSQKLHGTFCQMTTLKLTHGSLFSPKRAVIFSMQRMLCARDFIPKDSPHLQLLLSFSSTEWSPGTLTGDLPSHPALPLADAPCKNEANVSSLILRLSIRTKRQCADTLPCSFVPVSYHDSPAGPLISTPHWGCLGYFLACISVCKDMYPILHTMKE